MMSLKPQPDGDSVLLVCDGETDDKQWVCHLTDTDAKYRFQRDFVCYEGHPDDGCNGHILLRDGDIVEHVTEDDRGNQTKMYWQMTHDRENRRAALDRIDVKYAEKALQ